MATALQTPPTRLPVRTDPVVVHEKRVSNGSSPVAVQAKHETLGRWGVVGLIGLRLA